MQSVNPYTESVREEYDEHDETDVEEALSRADDAFEEWREWSLTDRRRLLADAGEVLRENEEKYAELMTEEMGKPISQARSEVEKCAWVCDYYAEHAGEHLQEKTVKGPEDAETYVRYDPLGPILAVMPWNFPLWQVFRFLAPHLTSGNVGLLKHASNVPGCALAIEEVLRDAGYPEDVFQSLLVGSDQIEDVIADDRVRAVTLTGSGPAGRAVAEQAGESLKKSVLELGGSDPYIVLDDAPLDEAAETGAQARTINSGQSCIAAKRFIVHDDVYDEFVEKFVDEMEALDVGDPKNEETNVGPQAREDLMSDLQEQVEETVEMGATVETGGEPMDREGYFYPPTVLTDVPRDSPGGCEEMFGPVASVFRVESEEEAVALANDSQYGLGGSVWTEDLERGKEVAADVESGAVFVNELTKSDPRLPFGGVKQSGYGRELGVEGIHEFVNRKTVFVQHGVGEE
ncbi:NAD-dependent succinate-semialdehyde dehydrogenase [Halogeometricum sp. S1BR25-6]|uniref:NAD-dependent succinate-semialdehyde dehydrogenase n=1 Tax=Halogeometricum salsisoli TaxID=2950536 RepID=A0ABU2GJG2_9EURY|nr:NAD-dependent succinate-semialdehyde dehydrogenase [Halogeometricum sp. S1BR25-6]MDS0300433.1 NAD-dependent succinate-semialdehyde dehydrogenase [Halogeometricum sp. S1BR25-6]